MKQNNPFHNWKNDPRLKHMDPDRLSLLMDFAKELADAPQNDKMSCFMSINKRAADKKMIFSNDERDLLLSVLTEQMSPEEKKKVTLIRTLASRLNGNRN